MVALIETVTNLRGEVVKLPGKGEHPCFGQRQGWCKNKATWRMTTDYLLLHFCDECRTRPNVNTGVEQWTKLG